MTDNLQTRLHTVRGHGALISGVGPFADFASEFTSYLKKGEPILCPRQDYYEAM